ncbi:MAG: hypothetical protein ABIH42_07440 [Planctomycetota bacterium]
MNFSEKVSLSFSSAIITLKTHRIMLLLIILASSASGLLYFRLFNKESEIPFKSVRPRGFTSYKYNGPPVRILSLEPWGVDPFKDPIFGEVQEKKKKEEQEKLEKESKEKAEKERLAREQAEREHLAVQERQDKNTHVSEQKRLEEKRKKLSEFKTFLDALPISSVIYNQRGVSSIIVGLETYLEGDKILIGGKYTAVIKKIEPLVVTLTFDGEDYPVIAPR